MRKDAVVVTGSSGFIGAALIEKLALHFVLGDLDRGGEHYMRTAKRSLPTANKGEGMSGRDTAIVSGALIALGILGIVDN